MTRKRVTTHAARLHLNKILRSFGCFKWLKKEDSALFLGLAFPDCGDVKKAFSVTEPRGVACFGLAGEGVDSSSLEEYLLVIASCMPVETAELKRSTLTAMRYARDQ